MSNQNKDAVLRWKSPDNIDFSHNVIYRSEINNVRQAMLLVNIKSEKGSYNTYLDTIEQSSYYWISSVDISGNESDKIFAGSVII